MDEAGVLPLSLHPLHAVQTLTYAAARHPVKTVRGHSLRAVQNRTGLPVADAVNSFLLARSMIRSPLQTSFWLTTQALGLPALPVRLATLARNMAKQQVQSL